MVLVIYRAEGTSYQTGRERSPDAADPRFTTVQVAEDVSIQVEIELPNGHVNLDAYSIRTAPDHVAEDVQHTVGKHVDDRIEVDAGTIESTIDGSADAWVRAARRWITERVEEGDTHREEVRSALDRFDSWDDTQGVKSAILQLDEYDDLSPLRAD